MTEESESEFWQRRCAELKATGDALSVRLAQAEQERDEARADYDALADDALSLLDQHLSAEVRRETQMRIVDRLADKR